MTKLQFNAKVINQPVPATGRIELWDEEAQGLGLRIMPSGRRTWTMKYSWLGKQQRVTLGEYPGKTLAQARALAYQYQSNISEGNPPHLTRDERKPGVPFRVVAAEFIDKHVNPKLRKSTAKAYGYVLREIAIPALGHLAVDQIQPRDLEDIHRALAETPRLANMSITVMSKVFERSEAWGYRQPGTNPCLYLERFEENKRERILSKAELKALWHYLDALDAAGTESVYVTTGIRFSILTGMRPGEVWTLTWPSVDLDHATLTLQLHKTSRRAGRRLVALNEKAVALLAALPRKGRTSLIFPGDRPGCMANFKDAWLRIRRAVKGVEDVHLHDLRHTFGTFAELQNPAASSLTTPHL